VAHDVSLTYLRFDHMSPAGVALAALLHGAVAFALWWASPLHPLDQLPDAIEITMEQEAQPPPPPEPPPPETPPAQAATPPPPPPVQQTPPARMGLRPPIGTTMDQRAPLSPPPPDTTTPEKPVEAPTAQETAKPESAKEAAAPDPPKEIVKVEPPKESATAEPAQEQQEKQQQQAALAPQPPAPNLENALPPVEAPPPPVTSREIPALAPPPPPKPAPQPAPRAPTPPPPAPRAQTPQQQLAPSPLHPPQPHAPTEPQQAARPAPSPLTNPADQYGQRKAQEDYLWQVVRKIAQHRYYPKSSRENSEEGLVVTLVTIARDGRLLDVTISRSSGFRTLDNAVLEVIRAAAPYAPLPNDVLGDRHTFVLPLNYRRTDPH
jgi:periplasmic protein TonB